MVQIYVKKYQRAKGLSKLQYDRDACDPIRTNLVYNYDR